MQKSDILSLAQRLMRQGDTLNPGFVLDYLKDSSETNSLPDISSAQLMRDNYVEYLRLEYAKGDKNPADDVNWIVDTLSRAIAGITDDELMSLAGLSTIHIPNEDLMNKLVNKMG